LTYDVFLSHSWQDKERTDRLYEAFERAGLAVWYDRRSQRDFESITHGIDAGLRASRGFVAFYSLDYPTRRACQYELTAAFVSAAQVGDPRGRLLALNPEPGYAHILPVELRDALIATPASWIDDADLDGLVERIRAHLEKSGGRHRDDE
jgi:hypothetical protein